jgi:serine/threonine protein phosphatase 1
MQNNRLIFIGDVHGCIQELNILIDKLLLRQQDQLIFIGDLIDKGPDSVAVVRRFFELKNFCKTSLILGNHEEKFLRYHKHLETGTGKEKDMKGTDEFPNLCQNLSAVQITGLKAAYYSMHFPENSLVALHGGLGSMLHCDFPKNYKYSVHSPKEFKGLDLITKTRYLNPAGKFVTLGEEKEEDKFWAETYDGKFGKVVFGHQPFLQESPMIFPYAFGIDTGCVFGGWLTAMVVENENISFVHVKALDAYAQIKTK